MADLTEERTTVREALHKRRQSVAAMEYFGATAATPLDTALKELRAADVMVLVIGFEAGSLIPHGGGTTFTQAEYKEAISLGKHVLVFVKQEKRWPWSKRREWRNKERSKERARSLANFRAEVGSKWTWDSFSTADGLALGVIQALNQWEDEGRPGARKTFASAQEYFAAKAPRTPTPILDFTTSLFGRDDDLQRLNSFLNSDSQCVCMLTGRGGIGKSKLLHDWSQTVGAQSVVFLKDEPLWHEDSEKEIPAGPVVLVVDDAHRSESVGRISQLFRELRRKRAVKLVLSSRPGGSTKLAQDLYVGIDASEIVTLPELLELNKEQAVALARNVLGADLAAHADFLAEVAGNTPLVIVAGGRLVASRRIHPAELGSLEEFRNTIFNRFLKELQLEGPAFAISPTRPLLDLIAALGPVDVDSEAFLSGAEAFLKRSRDEILSTLDELGAMGVVTRRGTPLRVLPDVLADFILEHRCVGKSKQSTQYAERVYDSFGSDFFRNLMRNLSELDWRLENSGYGLELLAGIWQQIRNVFLASDGYGRQRVLEQLAGAAVYQPKQILRLIDLALQRPIQGPEDDQYAGQQWVLKAIPRLLEATAHHSVHLKRSVDLLWELAVQEPGHGSDSSGAKEVLKRLASYDRYGWAAFNFAMLLCAVRLSSLPNSFDQDFTPITLIDELLEREGEFSELSGNLLSFGGFGLNIAAVGPLRRNALEFLNFSLHFGADIQAVRAAKSLGSLLHGYLPRVARQASDDEITWQNEERLESLNILARRFDSEASLIVRARVYSAIRSGTGSNCPALIQNGARATLLRITRDPDLIIMDALCTGENDLPMTTGEFDADTWEKQNRDLMAEAHGALQKRHHSVERPAVIIGFLKLAMNCRIEPRGFPNLIQTFADDAGFLGALADQLLSDQSSETLTRQLTAVLQILHSNFPQLFHARATMILKEKELPYVDAAAGALRVHRENGTLEDVAQIKKFALYPDGWVKRRALYAIAYMGKNLQQRMALLDAALSLRVEGDKHVAAALADAFGPYGIPISLLDVSSVEQLLNQFLHVDDFDVDQGRIPRFLNELTPAFPDEVLDLLLARLALERKARDQRRFKSRTLGLVHGDVSFSSVKPTDRLRLAKKCLDLYLESNDEHSSAGAKIFWLVAGREEQTLHMLFDSCDNDNPAKTERVIELIRASSLKLAFHNLDFTRAMLGKLSGSNRQKLVEALVADAHSSPSGAFAGSATDYFSQRKERIKIEIEALPSDAELADLGRALKQSIEY